jgi:RNA polymerase sigma factor (sigma-70 family)
MTTIRLPAVLQHLRVLAAAGLSNDLSDGQLLHRFAQTRDEGAFEALVRRHSSLVYGVCQRILGPGPDQADAFQATFLVLARKAGSVRKPASVGSWLHGIARRLALRLKYQRIRRQQRERGSVGLDEIALPQTGAVDPVLGASLRELGRILDEEVERLPARQRDVLVLCHLEGLSAAEAARRLGCPPSTLKSRLLKARAVMQQRLRRRGITLSVTALSLLGAEQAARAAVPASQLRAAVQVGTAQTAPARAALLADQVVRTAAPARLALAALALTLLGLAGTLLPVTVPGAAGEPVAPPRPVVATQPPPAAKDLQGDPLPAGALARMGSTRWRHGGVTGFVAFLPDGKHVISAGVDRVFHVWEFPSGKELRRFGPGVEQPLPPPVLWRSTEMPVALSGDGKILAFHIQEAELQLYDVATGKKLAALEQWSQMTTLAFSPDGRHVAVRDMIGRLTIWDWKARKAQSIFVQHPFILGEAPSLIYSPDGNLLAMTSQSTGSSTIKVVDPRKEKGAQIRTLETDQETYITTVLFSPDGKRLACADRKSVIRLLDVATGKQLAKFQFKERGPIGLVFSRDGKSIVARSMFGQTVAEWDAATGKELRNFGPVGRQDPPHGDQMLPRPALSPDGTVVAFAGADHALHFLDLTAGKEVHGDGRPTLPLTTVGWGQDGKTLWTQSYGKALRQWDPAAGKEVAPRALSVNVYQTALSADAGYLATAPFWDKAGKIIRLTTGKEVGQIPPRKTEGNFKIPTPTAMAFSSDGAFLAVRWESAQQLEVYAVPQGKLLHTLGIAATPRDMNVNGLACWPVMAFSADGTLLAAYSAPEALSVWDTATGRLKGSLSLTGNPPFAGIAFTLDGHCLAVETSDGDVALWELATCKPRRVFAARDARPKVAAFAPSSFTIVDPAVAPSANVAFSPRGDLLVYGAPAGDIHVWQVQTGQEVATFRGHNGVINAFALSADGKTLASASTDTTVLTWDLSAALSRPLPRHTFTDAELMTRWDTLAGDDARQAYSALCDLVAAPAQAVALLNQRLRPAPALDPKAVNRLIAAVGDPAFDVRKKATAALLQLDERVVPVIDNVLAGKPALEVRIRLEKIHATLSGMVLAKEKLRSYRAIEVLERLGTPEARRLLQRLADGAPGATETTAARQALRRWPL